MKDSLNKKQESACFWGRLALILLLALAFRIYIIVVYPGNFRADEVFQYLEPAHKLAFGTWIRTWEWREGIRSWLLPEGIAYLFRWADALHITNLVYFIRCVCAVLSLLLVGLFYWAGWLAGRAKGACVFGIIAALWPDIVNGSIHTAGEFMGGNLLASGVIMSFIALRARESMGTSAFRGLLYVSAFLLGAAAAVRFQFAPAVAAALLYLFLKAEKADKLFIVLFAGVPIAVLGYVDKVTLGVCYQSVLKNFHMNVDMGIANKYGKKSMLYFPKKYAYLWGILFLPVFFFCWKRYRQHLYPLLVALCIVFYHTLIAHKEMSFIYPAIVLFLFCASFGVEHYVAGLSITFWRVCVLLGGGLFLFWESAYQPELEDHSELARLEFYVARQPSLHGLVLFAPNEQWGQWGNMFGYTGLPKGVPFYKVDSYEELSRMKGRYNYIIAYKNMGMKGAHITKERCADEVNICVYKTDDARNGEADFDQFSSMLEKGGE